MKRLASATLASLLVACLTATAASATSIAPSTTSDDITNNGNCTLREAVQAANTDTAVDQCPAGSGGDVIQLGTATYALGAGNKEDANQTGDLDVKAPVTIQGNGAGSTTIDAQSNDRAIDVFANTGTTLQNLTLTNGATPTAGTVFTGGLGESGGAVRSLSRLTLAGVDVLNSHAGDGRTVSNTLSPGGSGSAGGDGGGVWANQEVTITGGSFVGDHAGNGSGGNNGTDASSGSAGTGGHAGDGARGGNGGAITVAGGAALSVTDTTFRADHAGAGGVGGEGGAGGSNPGGTGGTGGPAGNGGAGGGGGAISATGPAALVGISTTGTQAGAGSDGGKGGSGGSGDTSQHFGQQGTNGNGGSGGSGGALAGGAGTLTVSAGHLDNATAGAGGAGPQVVEPSASGAALAGAGGAGGAVSGGSVHVDHTLISNAHAGAGGMSSTEFAPSTVAGAGGAGGGIDGSSVTVSDSTITGSVAGAGGPGGNANFASGGSGGPGGGGGGVHAASTLSIAGVTLDHDTAGAGGRGGGGGGLSHAGGGAGGAGGGVLADQGGLIENTTLDADTAGAGGAAGSGGPNGHGGGAGGVRALNAALTISRVTVTQSAPGAGPPANGSIPAGVSGAVGGISGPAAVNDSVVSGNTAPQCAGTANGSANVSFPDASCGGANADPKLGSFGDNGGPTKTLLPGPGSPALDGSSCTGADQRGVPRPQGPACDSGAVEAANPAVLADGGAFGALSQGGTDTKTITVHATFDPLHPQVSLSSADFSLVSDGCSGIALAPAATCAVQVKFTATPSLGARNATLHLTHDAAGPALDVPLTATVVDTAPPVLSGLALTHKTFRVAKRKPAPKGTTIRFNLSEAASVEFTVMQKLPGRRKGKRCVAPTKKLRHAKHCTRTITLGSFTRSASAGASSLPFNGRVNGRKLKPGSYTLTVSPTDLAGNHGLRASIGFRIVKK
jgi:CSLREA domain-containing protein